MRDTYKENDTLGFPQLGLFVEKSLRKQHLDKEDAIEVSRDEDHKYCISSSQCPGSALTLPSY